ncbi:hypothetical protein RINTHM_6170 [Richelia intracellularis HM01]|nr:hypothetical protein RINTHM_6170 [Richelia intracellularis HM01]
MVFTINVVLLMNPTFAHGNIVYILLECDPVPVETSRI